MTLLASMLYADDLTTEAVELILRYPVPQAEVCWFCEDFPDRPEDLECRHGGCWTQAIRYDLGEANRLEPLVWIGYPLRQQCFERAMWSLHNELDTADEENIPEVQERLRIMHNLTPEGPLVPHLRRGSGPTAPGSSEGNGSHKHTSKAAAA